MAGRAETPQEITDAALALHGALCDHELLFDCSVYGLGTVRAHAKGKSLEEWVLLWAETKGS